MRKIGAQLLIRKIASKLGYSSICQVCFCAKRKELIKQKLTKVQVAAFFTFRRICQIN